MLVARLRLHIEQQRFEHFVHCMVMASEGRRTSIECMLQGLNGTQPSHTYDLNGNLTGVRGRLLAVNPGTITMVYDKENRMVVHNLNGTLTTSTYSADGLKRAEITSAGTTTLVWDGTDYLQERS